MTEYGEIEKLPSVSYQKAWASIKIDAGMRERVVANVLAGLRLRQRLSFDVAPVHGLIVLAGPPGTGKTSLALGLADHISRMLPRENVSFLKVDPHGLASAALGKSQQQTTRLFTQTIAEGAQAGPLIVLLDEVETLAASRSRMSLETNPIDVHRATDAVLSGMDHLARHHRNVVFLATTNFEQAVDAAFLSRADQIERLPLPDHEIRCEIIRDTLQALSTVWPTFAKLANDAERFASASEGLDGRQVRKAILASTSRSIETAKDPNLTTSAHIFAAIASRCENPTLGIAV